MDGRRVTIVAHELRGIRPSGGMGTATTFLALALARMGHSVELLLGIDSPTSLDPYWQSVYDRAGIRLRRAPKSGERVEPWHFAHTHGIQLGLRAEPPDVVVAHDFGAPAYSALRLRQVGVAFEHTLFVVFCHGPRRYIMDLAQSPRIADLHNLLAVTVQEEAAIELADVVVSPSAYLLDWMRARGWRLPQRTLVISYFTRATATDEPIVRREWDEGERLERLVFFGRLDERKGLSLLAAALNAIDDRLLAGIELEFLGKLTGSWPRDRVHSLLSDGTKHALRSVVLETDLDQPEALARLSRPGTLVVMPSLQENSPNAVYECLELGIPFVASKVGGVEELISHGDRARILFEPTREDLESALRRVLSARSVPRPAEPSFARDTASECWAEVVEQRPSGKNRRAEGHVEVVVVRRGSDAALERCLAALERQTYADFSVSVLEGSSVEAARERARRASSAPYIVFLDEEDVPDAELLRTLVQAVLSSGADVATCGLRVTSGDERSLQFFTGEPEGLGALANAYGAVGLFRREVLGELRDAQPAADDPDWPLLAGLNMSGTRIVSVPEPLVERNVPPASVERNAGDALLVAQRLEQALPAAARSTARLVAGLAAQSAADGTDRSCSLASRALGRLFRGGR